MAYPTDRGLLAKGVAKLVKLTAIKAAALAGRTMTRDRTRSVRRRAHAIAAWLRRRTDDAKEEVKAITAEMPAIVDARHFGDQRPPRPAPGRPEREPQCRRPGR